jgi:Cysteine rich repeat
MSRPWRFVCSGAVALGFLGAGLSGAVRAQEIPCTEEIRTFCAGVQPGGGRIMQCLKTNEAKLTPACTGRMNDLQETVSGPLGVCRDDWVAYCYHPRVSTGRQEMTQCLHANQEKVSAGCQKALQGMGGKRGQPRGSMP